MLSQYLPVLVIVCIALVLAGVFTLLASLLGPSRKTPEKQLPYETGMDPISSPRIRFNVHYYRVALLFLIFDLEAVFFYPWSVLFRELSCTGELSSTGACATQTSVFGLASIGVFLLTLVLALVHVWKKGALRWE